MYIIVAIVAAAAYLVSAHITYAAVRAYHNTPKRNLAVYGITGMIAAGFVLGSALEHVLP